MRSRPYFLLPDIASARATANELLLARIEDRHMHFLATRGTDLGELHEANFLYKTDLVHGAAIGLMIGSFCGLLLGILLFLIPPAGVKLQLVTILITTVVAGSVGAWIASIVGTSVPNSRLNIFHDDIAHGKILLIVDVPSRRVEWLRELIVKLHPEAKSSPMESSTLAFP